MQPGRYYSLGVHPWYISKADFQLKELEAYITNKQVLALGESGLDSLCSTDFALQENVFARQVVIANTMNKPLILHCVKAFPQIIQILRRHENKMPVIFHGFNRNQKLAKQLTDAGYYLSFGKAVFSKAMEPVIKELPPDQVFFENDDAAIPIAAIYEKAAHLMRMPVNTLSLQVQHNTEKLLHISF